MDRGDDFDGKVIHHPKSKGVTGSAGGTPPKLDRGEIDHSIDRAVSKRKTLGKAFIDFVSAAPIWLWLIVAGVSFALAKTLEYLTERLYAHMIVEAQMHVSQNSVDMMFAWNRLAHFLNGIFSVSWA